MTRLRLNTLRALALLGLGVSIYLVRQHIQFELTGDPGGLCSLVKAFDCSAIEASAFSAKRREPSFYPGFTEPSLPLVLRRGITYAWDLRLEGKAR